MSSFESKNISIVAFLKEIMEVISINALSFYRWHKMIEIMHFVLK